MVLVFFWENKVIIDKVVNIVRFYLYIFYILKYRLFSLLLIVVRFLWF